MKKIDRNRHDDTFSELDYQEASRIARLKHEQEERLKKMAKPSLLTRYFSALLDFIFVAIGVLVFAAFLLTPMLNITNYGTYTTSANTMLIETGLYHYLEDGDTNNTFTKTYDYESADYNLLIENYYTKDARAIKDNKIDEYNQAKLSSNLYYDNNGNITLKADANSEELKTFLTAQYESACEYAKKDNEYISLLNKTFVIFFMILLLFLLFSTSIFYLLIPMLRKEGETLAQIIFKICLIDTRDISQVKRGQIFIRFLINVGFNYYLCAVLYITVGPTIMLLPILLSVFTIGFNKKNMGFACLATNTMIINKSRTSARQILDDMTAMSQRRV